MFIDQKGKFGKETRDVGKIEIWKGHDSPVGVELEGHRIFLFFWGGSNYFLLRL